MTAFFYEFNRFYAQYFLVSNFMTAFSMNSIDFYAKYFWFPGEISYCSVKKWCKDWTPFLIGRWTSRKFIFIIFLWQPDPALWLLIYLSLKRFRISLETMKYLHILWYFDMFIEKLRYYEYIYLCDNFIYLVTYIAIFWQECPEKKRNKNLRLEVV